MKKDRSYNTFFIGQPGKGTKITSFRKEDFKPELAPQHARIETIESNGEEYVIMSYDV